MVNEDERSFTSTMSLFGIGYTVRPSTLPLQEEATATATTDGGGGASTSSASAHFHALRVPVKFDTDGISAPNWSPPNHHRGDANSFEPHIHRVTCNQDFPSTWQPARRIITFMGLVSLVCTLLVVVIIIIAVALSRSTAGPRDHQWLTSEGVAHLFPTPRRFVNRTPTIVVHRQNRQIWKKHVADLTALLKAYKERQGTIATSNCDLHYAPIGVSSCSFPLERISDNCTAHNNFGYDSGNPCVALVFNVHSGWIPVPYNKSNPAEIPEEVRHGYDEHTLPITCDTSAIVAEGQHENSSLFRVNYSPFAGFPFKYLPFRGTGSGLPPLVMIQFVGSQSMADVEVSCTLWAKNLPRNSSNNDPGSIRFSFFIV